MANAFRLSNAAASAAAGDGTNKGIGAFIGAGAKISFYVGAPNTTPESAPAGAALSTSTNIITGSYGTASDGVITTSTIASDTAIASGTAGSFWHTQSNGSTPVADGTVGATTGYDINFTPTNIFVAGGTIALSSMTITVPPH